MSTRLTSILFADDTSCFIEGTDLSDMCIQLSTEMNKPSTWFKTNRLSLNVSKTNCMIFGRSNQPDHHRVYIDNIVIERVNCNKFLGVIILKTIMVRSCIVHTSPNVEESIGDA